MFNGSNLNNKLRFSWLSYISYDGYIKAKENGSLLKAQEEHDLFESRLKEAVDDLEELECERDKIRVELDRHRLTLPRKKTLLVIGSTPLKLTTN